MPANKAVDRDAFFVIIHCVAPGVAYFGNERHQLPAYI